jgi:hypothetical protein
MRPKTKLRTRKEKNLRKECKLDIIDDTRFLIDDELSHLYPATHFTIPAASEIPVLEIGWVGGPTEARVSEIVRDFVPPWMEITFRRSKLCIACGEPIEVDDGDLVPLCDRCRVVVGNWSCFGRTVILPLVEQHYAQKNQRAETADETAEAPVDEAV